MDIFKETTGASNQPQEQVCLDFANTVEWRSSGHPLEGLNEYNDLVSWSQKVGLLDESKVKRLLREAETRHAETQNVLKRSIELREAIYHIFSATTHGEKPRSSDLQTLNDVLPQALSRLRVARSGEQFVFDWEGNDLALDQMLWPVAKSAAELLVSPDLGRVRECANEEEGCGWLFTDSTKNHNRRWCAMDSCGNRAKARRYYKRVKARAN
jgi:predicted RNA-binding Zn ribbon-like protein